LCSPLLALDAPPFSHCQILRILTRCAVLKTARHLGIRNFSPSKIRPIFAAFLRLLGKIWRSFFQSNSRLGSPVHSPLSTGAGYLRSASEVDPLIQEGDTVRFQVVDIFLPAADDLPKSITPADQLEGTVVNFSDSGLLPRVFAVVDVIARLSVVVPVEKLQLQNLGRTPNIL
jgi:hypothetical protein